MSAEVWKAVPGYEGAYEVSDLGRVRSLDRSVPFKCRWGHVVLKRIAGRVIVQDTDTGGYPNVKVSVNRQVKCLAVHVLVATVFCGPKPPGAQVRHKNGKQTDNRAINLQWGTQKENHADKRDHGTHLFGERHPGHVLTEDDVRAIRRARGVPQKVLGDRYGVSFQLISDVQLGKRWRHVA